MNDFNTDDAAKHEASNPLRTFEGCMVSVILGFVLWVAGFQVCKLIASALRVGA